ncbi:hypothetical protein ACFLRU_01325 [Bacteroidota bacterium]
MEKRSKTELIDYYQNIIDVNKLKIKKIKKRLPYIILVFILIFIVSLNFIASSTSIFWGKITISITLLTNILIATSAIYIISVIYYVRKKKAENKILNQKLYKLMSLE